MYTCTILSNNKRLTKLSTFGYSCYGIAFFWDCGSAWEQTFSSWCLWQYYSNIASIMQTIFILDIIIIPCPHPVGSMVADSWKNNISFIFFCLFTWLVAMLQCYDIACSYFYVCLHNCELVHLQDYVATSFDKPLCIEPEIDSLTVF